MEFKEYRLEDLVEKIFSGGTPSTKKKEYWNGNVNWLSSGETSSDFIHKTNAKITKLGIDNSSTKLARKNDVIMASAGQGKTRAQTSYLMIDTFINQSLIAIRTNKRLLDEKYLYYNLKSRYYELRSISDSASTRGSISTKMLKELNILVPKIDEQKKISNILFSLDKKIEVNNKIIANLEEQALAIFKSWFVDFEPFQDGKFVESELGMIPEGWEVKKLKEIFEFKKGRKPKVLHEKIEEKYIPYLVKGVIDGSEIPKFTNEEKIVKIDGLDTFMLMDGANSGNIYYGFKGALGSTFSLLETRDKKYDDILYWFLKINEPMIKNQNTGSAIPHANKDFIYSMNIAVPDNCKNDKISKVLRDFRRKIIYNNEENKILSEIRDALLPKLMSGEIDVSNIKIKGEEVKNE